MYCLFALLLLTFSLLSVASISAAPMYQEDPAELCEEGLVLFQENQHAEALPLLEAGFAAWEEGDFAEVDDLGLCSVILGFLRANRHNFDEALEAYEVALIQFQSTNNRLGEGLALNNIGDVYRIQGQYDEALKYYEQALAIARDIDNRASEGITLNNIATVYGDQGFYDEALKYYEQALAIARDIDDRASEGITLNNIGGIYRSQGRFEDAIHHYQQALTIMRESNDRMGEGTVLNNIGEIHQFRGRYHTALNHYLQALNIHREVSNRAMEGVTLTNIGVIYHSQGRFEDAIHHYQQALTIMRKIDNQVGESDVLNNIGMVYASREDYTEALEYYEQALAINPEVGVKYSVSNSITLSNIGAIYVDQNRYDDALEHFQQTLAIMREVDNRTGEGIVLNNIGVVYRAQGRYDKALEYYQQALAIQREVGDQAGEGTTLTNIGWVYFDQANYDDALDYYQQALNVLEDVRATAGTDEARAGFISAIEEQTSIYDATVIAAYNLDEFATAFNTSERGRARTFLDALSTGQVQLADNEASELLERESTLYAERQAVQDALAQARAADPPNDDLIADLEADLEQLHADYAAVQEDIAAQGDQLAALVPGRSAVPGLSEIQAALDADTTLLSYWVTEEQTFAFIVTQDALEVVELEVTQDDLLDRVEALRRFSDLGEPHPAAAVELHEMLIAPVTEHLTTPTLAIVPHDVLHYLPFAGLSDGERFLVDDYTLTLLPSASSLLHIQQNTGNELTAPLVLGNPATDNVGLDSLRFAEDEAETIAGLFDSTPLLGEAATEAEVRDGATAAGILHIAAHGAFEQAAPLESTLYLTPDGDDDGRLTVREIYALDLQQADLVVLSACETQIDDTGIVHGQLSVDSGDEIIGLTRAFFYAGTPSVVSTLWRVDDESSALLMERFYTHLHDGMGKSEALRQAQMDVREQHPNPYYWAGYVLSGDGGIGSDQAVSDSTSQDTSGDQSGGSCLGVGMFGLLGLAAVVATRRRLPR
jgi:CHAT domain-containing protein/Tfp pilus assembly protein PilF